MNYKVKKNIKIQKIMSENQEKTKTTESMIEIDSGQPLKNQTVSFKFQGNMHSCLKYKHSAKEDQETSLENLNDNNRGPKSEKIVTFKKCVHFLIDVD
jgi:hypothetical protein